MASKEHVTRGTKLKVKQELHITEKGDPRCDQQVKGDDKVTIKQDVHPRCDPSCCLFKNVIIVL
jgi:hypothetical protein